MKQALYALAAAGLGFIAAYFLLQPQHDPPASAGPDLLAMRVELLSRQVNALSRRLENPAPAVSATGSAGTADTVSGESVRVLEQRIAALETRLSGPSLRDVASQHQAALQSSNTLSGNARGEALFAAEPAIENRFYQAAVADAFTTLQGSLDLQDVACHGSVCRVTYTPAAGGGDSPTDDALLGALMGGFDTRQLQLHHGSDAAGNRVVYVKVP